MNSIITEKHTTRLFHLYSLFTFAVLNVCDSIITTKLILQFGFDAEANPILHYLLSSTGTVLILWLWKFIMLVLVALVNVKAMGTKHEDSWRNILIAVNVMMVFVVTWGAYIAINI